MNVIIFGSGFVGLITGVCLAWVGNQWCSTRDPAEGGNTLLSVSLKSGELQIDRSGFRYRGKGQAIAPTVPLTTILVPNYAKIVC